MIRNSCALIVDQTAIRICGINRSDGLIIIVISYPKQNYRNYTYNDGNCDGALDGTFHLECWEGHQWDPMLHLLMASATDHSMAHRLEPDLTLHLPMASATDHSMVHRLEPPMDRQYLVFFKGKTINLNLPLIKYKTV